MPSRGNHTIYMHYLIVLKIYLKHIGTPTIFGKQETLFWCKTPPLFSLEKIINYCIDRIQFECEKAHVFLKQNVDKTVHVIMTGVCRNCDTTT
jgi:hypothetical protein